MNQKGVIALAAPLLLLIAIAAVLFILISLRIIKNPLKSLPGARKEPTVSLQTQFINPFDKSAQYVNPFASYKNPFDALKVTK